VFLAMAVSFWFAWICEIRVSAKCPW